jgi:hypothetical protein
MSFTREAPASTLSTAIPATDRSWDETTSLRTTPRIAPAPLGGSYVSGAASTSDIRGTSDTVDTVTEGSYVSVATQGRPLFRGSYVTTRHTARAYAPASYTDVAAYSA